VLAELETDFPHLVLSRDIKLGKLIGTGGYAEVYEGTLKVVNSRNKTKVAVKRFRFISTREEEFTKVCTSCSLIICGHVIMIITRRLRENWVYGRGLSTRMY
jgi:hypothetical protein